MGNLTPEPSNFFFEDELKDETDESKLGLGSILLLLLMIAAMLTTLMWPVLWQTIHRFNAPPTPTSIFLQEA